VVASIPIRDADYPCISLRRRSKLSNWRRACCSASGWKDHRIADVVHEVVAIATIAARAIAREIVCRQPRTERFAIPGNVD